MPAKKQKKRAPVKKTTKTTPAVVTTVRTQSTAEKASLLNYQGRTAFYVIALIILLVGAFALIPNRTENSNSNNSVLQHIVTYKGVEGKNALELLKAGHKVETQSYSIGEFVTSIDGIAAPKDYFWSLYINGKASEVGADQYITKNSDSLSWKLVKIQ